MESNYTGVITPSSSDEARTLLDHCDHVEAEIDTLKGASERSANAMIADRHNEIGATFKRAEVVSNLAIAEALDRLTAAVARWEQVKTTADHRGTFLASISEGDPHR